MNYIQNEYITLLSNNKNIKCFDIKQYLKMTRDDTIFINTVLNKKDGYDNLDMYIKLATILDIFLYIFKHFIENHDDTHFHLFSIMLINILLDELITLGIGYNLKDVYITKIYTILKNLDFINFTNCYDDNKIDTKLIIEQKIKELSLIMTEIMF
tara:strand:+ start:20160 stop:20624 length:465 start_codon:yes stop_codon:yes gene_type:complete